MLFLSCNSCLQLLSFLLLFLSVSCQLDDEARLRFDKILADFGFSQSSRATVRDPGRKEDQIKSQQTGFNNLLVIASESQVRNGGSYTELPYKNICLKNQVESSQPSPPSEQTTDTRELRFDLRRPKGPPPSVALPSSSSRPGQRLTPNGVPIVSKRPSLVDNNNNNNRFNFDSQLQENSRVRPGLSNLLAIAGDPKVRTARRS